MFCTNGVLLRMLTQGEGEGEGMEVHAASPQQVLARLHAHPSICTRLASCGHAVR